MTRTSSMCIFPAQIVGILCTKSETENNCWTFSVAPSSGSRIVEAKG